MICECVIDYNILSFLGVLQGYFTDLDFDESATTLKSICTKAVLILWVCAQWYFTISLPLVMQVV